MEPFDETLKLRCPKLGGPVTLKYCLTTNNKLFCPRITTCWEGKIDISSIIKERFSPEEIDSVFSSPPKDKVLTLIELIEKAKKNKKKQ
ncbi:MAG: hypothetical protein JRI44_10010 [Deltaproteobacteria bacterium]|nr:hypothetical protein [Deltaproteobacteria bacterium]